MRARTITIISLLVCAFAVPASASADPASSDYSRADAIAAGLEESSQPNSGSNGSPYSGGPDYATPNSILGSDGLGEPTFVTGSPAGASDGFDWTSAAIGAAAAMALVALGGAALLTVRRRATVSPSAPAS
jgi:hypothetical protein